MARHHDDGKRGKHSVEKALSEDEALQQATKKALEEAPPKDKPKTSEQLRKRIEGKD